MPDIFNEFILKYGPWQEFERNTARLLMHKGWRDVRIVGRKGDGGADVLATNSYGKVWIFQCKFSTKTAVKKEVIDEIRNAGKLYNADVLCIVTSQKPTQKFIAELKRLTGLGLQIHHIGPDQLLTYSNNASLYTKDRLKLREYQEEALGLLREALLETGKAQLILATGLGKTVIIAQLVDDLLKDGLLGENRILVLAHTVPLVNQLLQNFWRHLPKTIPTHRWSGGEKPSFFDGITFATVQSLYNTSELPYFDLVIIDEAHHLGAPDYSAVVERLDASKVVGVTATPWRSDGVSIDHWLGPPVYQMGIKEGLANGFLSEVDYRIFVDNIDWNLVSEVSQFGYTIRQLNKKLLIPTRDEEAIRQIRNVCERENRKRGLIFSPSKVHAKTFASDLRSAGFTAASLTSDDDQIQRFKLISEFAAGRLEFLCVVDIFNEGIDVPDVDILVFLRVTHSRRIFIQQLGRGLRINPDKTNLIVLDFAADVRRIHAALDLTSVPDDELIERLLLSHAQVTFRDKSMGNFFYEWIADLGNIQDYDDEDLVQLPILDVEQMNFPEPLT